MQSSLVIISKACSNGIAMQFWHKSKSINRFKRYLFSFMTLNMKSSDYPF